MFLRNHLLFMMCVIVIFGCVACGGDTPAAEPTAAPAAETAPTAETETVLPTNEPEPAVEDDCPDYFKFCMTAEVTGSLSTKAVAQFGGDNTPCTEWVKAGESRILEMPLFMSNDGTTQLTIALTRIGEYTGPGSYELKPEVVQADPDSYPAVNFNNRTFNNGEGTTAIITVAEDGSGTVQATGLVEIASMMVSDPDPNAKIDLTMTWVCQDQ